MKPYAICKNWYNDLRWATIFLTRIPAYKIPGQKPKHNAATLRTAPIVGLIVAIPTTLIFISILIITTPLIAAIAATITAITLTGALHEDGLADTTDGFGAGKNKEKTIRIMRDSTIGTYGTIAICIILITKITAINTITISQSPTDAVIAITIAAIWSRTLLVPFIAYTPPATNDGSGAEMSQISKNNALNAIITAIILITTLWITTGHTLKIISLNAALCTTLIALLTIRHLAIKKINGHTGDVSGAVQQITETLTLIMFTL